MKPGARRAPWRPRRRPIAEQPGACRRLGLLGPGPGRSSSSSRGGTGAHPIQGWCLDQPGGASLRSRLAGPPEGLPRDEEPRPHGLREGTTFLPRRSPGTSWDERELVRDLWVAGMHGMPGTNPHLGTRPPPAPSWTSRRTPSTWTPRRALCPIPLGTRTTTTIRFTCTELRRRDSPGPVGRDRPRDHASTVGLIDPATAYADSRIALTDLAADNEAGGARGLYVPPHGRGPATRFVDPADDRVYTYSQFEVPDARRVYTTFEQPTSRRPSPSRSPPWPRWVVSNSPSPGA